MFLDASESQAVDGGGAETANGLQVKCAAIPLVAAETVSRVDHVKLAHQTVAGDLGYD